MKKPACLVLFFVATGWSCKETPSSPPPAQAEFGHVVEGQMMRLRYCYERELRRSPTLRGKMRVVFQVDPSGQVSQCEISQIDFVKTPELVSCVEKTFLTMQFPGWTSGQPVTIHIGW